MARGQRGVRGQCGLEKRPVGGDLQIRYGARPHPQRGRDLYLMNQASRRREATPPTPYLKHLSLGERRAAAVPRDLTIPTTRKDETPTN